MNSKYFFRQFKDQLKEEKEKFDAYSESVKIEDNHCSHKNIEFVNGELRCPSCGCGWTGPKQQLIEVKRELQKN